MNKEAEIILTEVMKSVEDKGMTGKQKKQAVAETVVGIVKGLVPLANFIPNSIAEEGIEFCEDEALIGLKAIAHKIGDCIEVIFEKVFHKN